jgi:hypothetical protein
MLGNPQGMVTDVMVGFWDNGLSRLEVEYCFLEVLWQSCKSADELRLEQGEMVTFIRYLLSHSYDKQNRTGASTPKVERGR